MILVFDFCERHEEKDCNVQIIKTNKRFCQRSDIDPFYGCADWLQPSIWPSHDCCGSTSVQPYAEILAEEYMALNPDAVIDIQGGGSSAGITATKTHSADIGMSSRSLNDEEKNLWNVEIAKDGLVLIVNPKNPIQDLTSDQIRDIYAATITDWSQLGGSKSKSIS